MLLLIAREALADPCPFPFRHRLADTGPRAAMCPSVPPVRLSGGSTTFPLLSFLLSHPKVVADKLQT